MVVNGYKIVEFVIYDQWNDELKVMLSHEWIYHGAYINGQEIKICEL